MEDRRHVRRWFAGNSREARMAKESGSGPIDPRAVGPTNRPPALYSQQAESHTWTPDSGTWSRQEALRRASGHRQITGFSGHDSKCSPFPAGRVTIETSKDPVGAPIFYRDVPLMPSEIAKGVIKPLAPAAIPLIAWRLRYIGEPESRLHDDGAAHLRQLPLVLARRQDHGAGHGRPAERQGHVCARARFAAMSPSGNEDVIEWSSFRGKLGGKIRVGFMSPGLARRAVRRHHDQRNRSGPRLDSVSAGFRSWTAGSPEGSRRQLLRLQFQGLPLSPGVLSDSRDSGLVQPRHRRELQPLPGADDPRYVQTNAVWSPDGKYLVFARAEARDSVSRRRESSRNSPTIRTRPRSSTTSTASRSTAAKAERRSRSPAHPATA